MTIFPLSPTDGQTAVVGDIEYSFNVTKGVWTRVSGKDFIGREDGTFSPTLYGLTTPGVTSYTSQLASYTKIGNLVIVSGKISWGGTLSGTGGMAVGNLPYIVRAGTKGAVVYNYYHSLSVGTGDFVMGFCAGGTNEIHLKKTRENDSNTDILAGHLSTSGELYFTGTYFI